MLGNILIIAGVVCVVLGVIGRIMIKRRPEGMKDEDQVLENVADLNDRFNRARYQDGDGN